MLRRSEPERLVPLSREFRSHPAAFSIETRNVVVRPLPDQGEVVDALLREANVEDGRVYAPSTGAPDGTGASVLTSPFPVRVFGLPRTHEIEVLSSDGEEHLGFHLWLLSFFTGLRLTSSQAGFLDATPLRPGKLVDFLVGDDRAPFVELAEGFWRTNIDRPARARLVAAAIHALFLAQNPLLLDFERFLFLYAALDACYALEAEPQPTRQRHLHRMRIASLCRRFDVVVPDWATGLEGTEVANIRNAAVHEALFMGEPLGFATLDGESERNLPLEMGALTSRLLVAILGAPGSDYVRSPIGSRQRHLLRLP